MALAPDIALERVRALLNAPPEAYDLLVTRYPLPQIVVKLPPGSSLDTSSLPEWIDTYRVRIEAANARMTRRHRARR